MTAAQVVNFAGRRFELRVSRAAAAVLAAGSTPLVAEMELYFSCLIRKRVRVLPAAHPDALCVAVSERLRVCFRPVMTRGCAVREVEGSPELESFPIRRADAFVPRWLTLDWRHGDWAGEFGY